MGCVFAAGLTTYHFTLIRQRSREDAASIPPQQLGRRGDIRRNRSITRFEASYRARGRGRGSLMRASIA